jgi:hypothetical protein
MPIVNILQLTDDVFATNSTLHQLFPYSIVANVAIFSRQRCASASARKGYAQR